ncbi:MAG: hypothetical protein ACRDTG_17075 [Pseudonocardiaceae bacterium]
MSEVFHGYDERLDRRVAIKLLRPPAASIPAGPDSPEAVEILDALERDRKRFLREIRTTAQLEYPGTPAVYDTGVETAPDGSMQLWQPGRRGPITEAEAAQLQANVKALLDNDQPAEAIRLLKDGVERAGHDPFVQLRLRHFLAAALYYAGEYTRAAPLFDVVGRDYREHLAPSDAFVLDSFYDAGHAYAEIGEPDKALPQLRFYVHHAGAAGDEEADKVLGTRFVLAQMLAGRSRPDRPRRITEGVRGP